LLRTSLGLQKYNLFFHDTLWLVMAKGFLVKIGVCQSPGHEDPQMAINKKMFLYCLFLSQTDLG